MDDTRDDGFLSGPKTLGTLQVTKERNHAVQSGSLLARREQTQDSTKPYRVAFKGILTNDECSGD